MLSSRSWILAETKSMYICNFSLNWQNFMDQIFLKMVVPVKNRKSEHHHWILHIQFSLGTKIQL